MWWFSAACMMSSDVTNSIYSAFLMPTHEARHAWRTRIHLSFPSFPSNIKVDDGFENFFLPSPPSASVLNWKFLLVDFLLILLGAYHIKASIFVMKNVPQAISMCVSADLKSSPIVAFVRPEVHSCLVLNRKFNPYTCCQTETSQREKLSRRLSIRLVH